LYEIPDFQGSESVQTVVFWLVTALQVVTDISDERIASIFRIEDGQIMSLRSPGNHTQD
jgi:hypothetical protein